MRNKMENTDINEKIKQAIVKVATEPQNIDNYHDLAALYESQGMYDNMISTYEGYLQLNRMSLQLS